MKRVIILISFIFIASSIASADPITADDAFRNFLTARIFTLGKPLVTFSYQTENDGGFKPQNIQQAIQRIWTRPHRFFDKGINDVDMEGPGLYVDVDPFGSRAFGQNKPQLYVITLKAGTRILDLRDLTDDVVSAIRDFGRASSCLSENNANLAVDLSSLRNSNAKECRDKIIDIFSQFGIEAIIYDYTASNTLGACRNTRDEALNIISEKVIDRRAFAFFSDDVKFESAFLAPYVKKLYNESAEDSSLILGDGTPNWVIPKKLALVKTPTQDAYIQWKENFIWKCGSVRSKEAQKDEDLWSFVKYNITDNYLLNLEVVASRAMNKKMSQGQGGTNLFYFNKLRIVLKKRYNRYLAEGPAMTFSQWSEGMAALDSYGKYNGLDFQSRIDIAAAFFNEKQPPSDPSFSQYYSAFEPELEKLFSNKDPSILNGKVGLVAQIYMNKKLPQRVTGALVEQLFTTYGRSPFLTGKLPLDPNVDYSQQFQNDRIISTRILRACTKEYNDPQKSIDDINNGPCGIVSGQ